MEEVKMSKKEIQSANCLAVEVGTNTPKGGDSGITILQLEDNGGTTWTLKCKDVNGKETKIENPKQITIELYGGSEAVTFLECLEFAVASLHNKYLKQLFPAYVAK
jgi:hypothetical protein